MKNEIVKMKWKQLINTVFTVLMVLGAYKVDATHIVGGNIYYKCLGNNVYEVTLVMRRDCFNGDPEAFFDDPASIGIFDEQGKILTQFGSKGQLLVRYAGNVTIPADRFVTESYCDLVGTQTVCIHEATYKTTISLPYREGGYIFEYQRCCRNIPLVNITNPLETGATWTVHLTEEAQKTCNSSPVFNNWTNLFLCADRPYRFDHHATDADGDSLVYSLWTPNNGASKALPKPQPPNSTFGTITWLAPYSENDMLNGNSSFKINPVTGEITANPGTLGQFLLGVKVDEYRNGKKIGTVYRDWEVKVIDCSNLVDGRIVAPTLQCDDLSVAFKQESVNGKSFKWFFDYNRNKNIISTEENPTYKYLDTGTYLVALVITQDNTCFDTTFHTIRLKNSNSTKANFSVKMGNCVNGVTQVSITDLSTGVASDAKYQWVVSYNGITLGSSQKNPLFNIPNGALTTVRLIISEEGSGCMSTTSKTFITSFIQPEWHRDLLDICVGDTATVPFIVADSIKGKLSYLWDASALIVGDRTTATPKVLVNTPGSNYIYVTVDNKNGCTSRDSILIIARSKPKLDFRVENALGSVDAKFINLSDPLTNYHWDFGVSNRTDDTSALKDPSYKFPAKGLYTVTLSTKDGCAPKILKIINIGGDGIRLIDSINACIGNRININPKADPKYTYQWSPADKLSSATIGNPSFTVDSSRTFVAKLFDAATGVEVGTHTVIIKTPVTEQIKALKDTVLACAGIGVGLNPGGNKALKYEWAPANLLNDANAVNPIATVTDQTTFTVKITNPADTCVLVKSIVVVIPSKIALSLIPDSLEACINTPIALNPNGKTDPNLRYSWSPGRFLNDSTSFNPSATINGPTKFTVKITDIRFENCTVTKMVNVKTPILDEVAKIKDSVKVCANVATPINPAGDARYKYEWSPATGLDNPNLANPKATVSASTVYTAKITDTQRGGCSVTKSVNVRVAPPFTVVPTYKDSISCTSNIFKLGVKSDNPKVSFEWFDGTTSVSKSDTVTVTPSIKKVYRVIGTDENGCMVSADVNVDPARIGIDATAPNNGVICQGDSINLGVTTTGSATGLRFEWTPTSQIISGATTATPSIKPNTSVTYTVKVTNAQGCTATDTILIKVNPVSPITASATPTTITIGESSQLFSTNVAGYTYQWTPTTDLSNPSIPNPVAKPKQTTTYTLRATSPDGCVQTRSVTITVNIPDCAEPFIFLPNAFSPNGDGKNDVLFLRSNVAASMMLIIYNRWGEKVFETRNQSIGWDGTFRGKPLNPDAYGYYLTVDCINGQKFTKKGNVTILK